eukprot:3287465-Pyramimonas_sp.AAC.1
MRFAGREAWMSGGGRPEHSLHSTVGCATTTPRRAPQHSTSTGATTTAGRAAAAPSNADLDRRPY